MSGTQRERAAESGTSRRRSARGRAADKRFPRTRTLKRARNREDWVSFRGHFSVAEELRWQKFSPRWVEDKEEGDKPRRCVSPWVPSVTVETLAFTLTGAIIIIIMRPVLRFNHQ